MTKMNDSKSIKQEKILECALQLLKESGDAGLTMRKVATCTGIRLSNVQYYYSTRDDLLKALVADYFEDCVNQLVEITKQSDAGEVRDRVEYLVELGLSHGGEISDMCRIFRELWAISSRNETVRNHMMAYYSEFADHMADYILGQKCNEETHKRLQCLLLPFFEGYSITAASLPLPMDRVVDLLTEAVMSIINECTEYSDSV